MNLTILKNIKGLVFTQIVSYALGETDFSPPSLNLQYLI